MRNQISTICGIGVIAAVAILSTMTLAADRLAVAEGQADAQDLRAQLLAVPLNPNLGGDVSVDTTGPRAFRSIAPNADRKSVV